MVTKLLLDFVRGPDRSITAAKRIESEILNLNLDEDPRFEEIVDILAAYQPGGGNGLYDENQAAKVIESALKAISD